MVRRQEATCPCRLPAAAAGAAGDVPLPQPLAQAARLHLADQGQLALVAAACAMVQEHGGSEACIGGSATAALSRLCLQLPEALALALVAAAWERRGVGAR